MGAFLIKVFAGFWIIWILWYLTGGPLRDDKTKPYTGIGQDGQIQSLSSTTTKQKP
jgi:hypothetical protein